MHPDISADRLDQAFEIAASDQEIGDILLGICNLLRIEHIVYTNSISATDPTISPTVRSTYPAAWLKRYMEMSYEKCDPILKRGYASTLPFMWSEIGDQGPAAAAMMGDAARHGVGPQGLSIPLVTGNGRRGLFSISSSDTAGDWNLFVALNLSPLREIAYVLHKRVIDDVLGTAPFHLTARELECLIWCSRGKEAGDIAAILGISTHTVRDYLKSTRFKLNCSNLPQAVARGIALGFITAP